MSFEINGIEPSSIIVNIIDKNTKELISSTELSSLVCNGKEVWSNDIWVACNGSSKGLYWSTDGKSWKRSNITDISFSGGARYSNGIWVVCSDNNNGLYWSTDGKNWTQSNITSGYFNGGAFTNYMLEMYTMCMD